MKNSLKIMKIVSVSAIIFLALLLTTCGGDDDPSPPSPNFWTSLGPEGGNVSVLVIDPVTTTTFYAGTWGGSGVYKSIDGGTSWSAITPEKGYSLNPTPTLKSIKPAPSFSGA